MRLAVLLLSATAVPAFADDSNFRPYLIGGRAGGMGGAFTALADDGSGPYYNPGGLAFVDKSQISLSASVYGLVSGTQESALGTGHDFKYSDLNIFPVSTSSVFRFGSAPSGGNVANAVALSVFVPDAFHQDDRTSLTAGDNQNAVFLAQDQQTIWVGASYARRLGPLGFGVSAFTLIGTSTVFGDLTAIASTSNFATLSVRSDSTVVGLVGALGVRWDVTDQVRIGLSFYSPELGLYGTRTRFVRAVQPTDQGTGSITVVNQESLHASPTLPYRAQGGIAWSSGRLTVAGDVILLGALETDDDPDSAERRIVRHAVLNGSLGAEWFLSDAVPVRFGLFTDFAASPSPVAKPPGQTNPNPANSAHIDRYGGTLSIGYHTEHTATDLGLVVSYGDGTELQARNFDFDDLIPTRSTQLLLYGFLSSAYRF